MRCKDLRLHRREVLSHVLKVVRKGTMRPAGPFLYASGPSAARQIEPHQPTTILTTAFPTACLLRRWSKTERCKVSYGLPHPALLTSEGSALIHDRAQPSDSTLATRVMRRYRETAVRGVPACSLEAG
jgi:hypothetical protein